MADEAQNTSLKNDMTRTTAAEDAETRAARRELKQSSISDPVPDGGDDKDRPATPADDVSDDRNNELKDQLASPKKKRGHDQLDAAKDEVPKDDASVTSADSSKDRASRSEPEKKRHRDQDGAAEGDDEKKDQEDGKTADITTQAKDGNKPESTEKDPKDGKDAPQTSASAFAASGFGKLSAGTSPFAGLGGTTGSGFGSPGKAPLSSFASSPKKTEADAQPAASAPKLSFGGAAAASPFAAGTNGFGSGLGGGSVFGSAKPLSAFGSGASKPFQTQKGAKPFGAPDSDVEEEEEEETGEEGEGADKDKDRGGSPEKESDDKAKVKLHKVDVDDGETGDATVLSVRAKMFVHENEAWKERGAGMLKINVPRSCVEFDDSNVVVPGSFDASGLDDDDSDKAAPKVVRLLMRQDQTHRVILNTAIISAMKFQEKTSLKSTSVLFTAFEGDSAQPLLVTMRMTAANAKLFQNEVDSIQRELQNR